MRRIIGTLIVGAGLLVPAVAAASTDTTEPDDETAAIASYEAWAAREGYRNLRATACAEEGGFVICYGLEDAVHFALIAQSYVPNGGSSYEWTLISEVPEEPLATTSAPVVAPADTVPDEAINAAELNSVLGPPAQAWIDEPSGSTFDALAAAARSLDYEQRGFAVDVLVPFVLDEQQARIAMSLLTAYPGTDTRVIVALTDLNLTSVDVPALIELGSYQVGVDVQPGTYKATNVSDCYWETLDQAGEINDNNFVTDAPQVLITIRPSDFAFNNQCALLIEVR